MTIRTPTRRPLPAVSRPPQPSTGLAEGIALAGATHFVCLGSECPDTCCSGWSIPLSRPDLEALRSSAAGSPTQERRFREAVREEPAGHVAGSCGTLGMQDGNPCGFLDPDGLCSVQKRSGPEAIPTICSLYPKKVAVIEGRLELTLSLSCPEAARVILTEADAVDLVDVDQAAYPRLVANHVVPVEPEAPYERYCDDVRAAILGLLALDTSFAKRLFLIAYMGSKVDPFYGRGRGAFHEDHLASVLRMMCDPDVLTSLCAEFDELDLPRGLGVAVAHEVFAHRAAHSTALAKLYADAHGSYGSGWLGRDPVPEAGTSFEDLRSSYMERAELWGGAWGARLDTYFTNYAVNYWMQGYLESDSILEHTRAFIAQCAVLKFLILGDPELSGVDPREHANGAERTLEDAVVRVVYRFTRATEHDPRFLRAVGRTLDDLGFTSFAHIVSLLRT